MAAERGGLGERDRARVERQAVVERAEEPAVREAPRLDAELAGQLVFERLDRCALPPLRVQGLARPRRRPAHDVHRVVDDAVVDHEHGHGPPASRVHRRQPRERLEVLVLLVVDLRVVQGPSRALAVV